MLQPVALRDGLLSEPMTHDRFPNLRIHSGAPLIGFPGMAQVMSPCSLNCSVPAPEALLTGWIVRVDGGVTLQEGNDALPLT